MTSFFPRQVAYLCAGSNVVSCPVLICVIQVNITKWSFHADILNYYLRIIVDSMYENIHFLPAGCVNATSVNLFNNRTDN